MMKKIFTILSVMAMGAALTGCDLNKEPVFDDKDAFVAFGKSSASVKETDGTISIPVTLASLSGISTKVSYEPVDSTAKRGVDYELADGASTLTFSKENRTQNIVINILPHKGEYTGDRKFILKFKSTGDVAAGYENTCVVTISDTDHPLNFILGEYGAPATTGVFGTAYAAWTVTVEKDEKDVSKVWLTNLDPDWIGYCKNSVYGVVNAEKTTITIPKDQEIGYTHADYGPVTLVGLDAATYEEAGDFADLIINISEDGSTLTTANAYGTNSQGWWNVIDAPFTFTKK